MSSERQYNNDEQTKNVDSKNDSELNTPHVDHNEALPELPLGLTRIKSSFEGRLDGSLRSHFRLSHKAARKLISTGKVSVSDELSLKWETPVKLGEVIVIDTNAPNPSKREALGATLIYQDQALAILSKSAGLLSAPGHDRDEDSALQAASRLCRGPRRPRVVHRLDKETSGLLMFARTVPAARRLQEMLRERSIKRVYHCIVRGVVQGKGAYISSQLVRDAGKGKRGSRFGSLKTRPLNKSMPQEPISVEKNIESGRPQPRSQWALTRYKVMETHGAYTALEVEIFTGRTHQIRIHLSEIGHPIVGEWVYAPRQKREPRLALHAARLLLTHPFTNEELTFESPWPQDLRQHRGLERFWQSKNKKKQKSVLSSGKPFKNTKKQKSTKALK